MIADILLSSIQINTDSQCVLCWFDGLKTYMHIYSFCYLQKCTYAHIDTPKAKQQIEKTCRPQKKT